MIKPLLVFTLGLVSIAAAGDPVVFEKNPVEIIEPAGFGNAVRPISNPTLFDLAVPQTQIHPFFAFHRLPTSVDTILGKLPVDGHVEVYAIQAEIALTDRLSFNATKDGYVRFRPDETLSKEDGWANIAAGLKYALILDEEEQLAVSGQLLYEVPTGNSDVFQGTGDGAFLPSVNVLKLHNRWQFANQFGFNLPVDGDTGSSSFYNSFGVAYQLTDRIFPMFEVNWFSVLSDGDGGRRFNSQVGGAVPAVVKFEGNDIFNFGAANAEDNRHLVTFALGTRARVCRWADLGFGWEFPVTSSDASVFDDRFYFDMVIRF